jgi:hypothetical protein
MHHVEHGLDIKRPAIGEEFVSHRQSVRRQDDIVQRKEWVIGAGWLGIKDIDAGACDAAGYERLGQRFLIDDGRAPCL